MSVRLKLPNYQNAIVSESKILDYLLSASHSVGRGKAIFFSSLGFSRERWEELANAFKAHAASNEVASEEGSDWGKNYSIIGRLECPAGRQVVVKSVWFVEHGGTVPRLITAYPE